MFDNVFHVNKKACFFFNSLSITTQNELSFQVFGLKPPRSVE
jgi:hypothetical protein